MANKTDLVNAVAEQSGITKKTARAVVDATINYITDTLEKEEKVTIPGFGSFSVGTRVARTGRNPQTGEKLEIPEKKVAKFRAGKGLRETVGS